MTKFTEHIERFDNRTVVSITGGTRPRMVAVLTIDKHENHTACHGIARADGDVISEVCSTFAGTMTPEQIGTTAHALVVAMRAHVDAIQAARARAGPPKLRASDRLKQLITRNAWKALKNV